MKITIQTNRREAKRAAENAKRQADEAAWRAAFNRIWDEYRLFKDLDWAESWLEHNLSLLNPHL